MCKCGFGLNEHVKSGLERGFYGDAMRCVANVMLNVTAAWDCEKSQVQALEKLEFLRCIMYFYGFVVPENFRGKYGFSGA